MFSNWTRQNMYKLDFLKEMMHLIVKECLGKYDGGESYFTEVDAMIKSNPVLMSEYIQYVTEKENIYNVILSGEIGLKYLAMQLKRQIPSDINLFLLPGGIRLDPSKLNRIDNNYKKMWKITSSRYVFLDDSYYSGKTLNDVSDFVKKSGGIIKKSYVFYDGAPKRTDVHSLYRYYDNFEN